MATPRAVGDLVDRTRATIERRSLLKGGETVVVAVSGGPHSLPLLHLLTRLAEEYPLFLPLAPLYHPLPQGSGADPAVAARRPRRAAGRSGSAHGSTPPTRTPRSSATPSARSSFRR